MPYNTPYWSRANHRDAHSLNMNRALTVSDEWQLDNEPIELSFKHRNQKTRRSLES